jgi:hypothetical protein
LGVSRADARKGAKQFDLTLWQAQSLFMQPGAKYENDTQIFFANFREGDIRLGLCFRKKLQDGMYAQQDNFYSTSKGKFEFSFSFNCDL